MKREDQILIDLLADFVNGQSPGALPEVSLDALYQTACKHNVTGVVAEMLHPFLETQKSRPSGNYRKVIWPRCSVRYC